MVGAILAGVLCGAALLATALNQLRRPALVRKLKSHDVFALIPVWTFFAPNPGTHDTRVLWRERLGDGEVSAWHELEPPTSSLLRGLWNPTKRVRKAITDCGPAIVRRASQQPNNKLLLVSIPYLMLLHHVAAQPGSPFADARQLVIVQTTGADDEDGDPKILLVSNWHALRPEDEAPLPTAVPEAVPA